MGVVEQTQPYQRKAVGLGRQQIAVVDWGNYCKGKLTPWRPESNWEGGDLGARLRGKGVEKRPELQFEETTPKEENPV